MNGILKTIENIIVKILMALIAIIGLFYLHFYEIKPWYLPIKEIK